MREILFKAKRKNWRELPKEKWWVEGFYFCMHHNDERNHIHHFILPLGADLSLGTPIEKIQVEVDSETVCQYIEVTDQNCQKIWENDIILIQSNNIDVDDGYFVVKWDNECSRFILEGKELVTDFENIYGYECEVISNIFDNPELLEIGVRENE